MACGCCARRLRAGLVSWCSLRPAERSLLVVVRLLGIVLGLGGAVASCGSYVGLQLARNPGMGVEMWVVVEFRRVAARYQIRENLCSRASELT